jgi:hypothetical protein
MGFLDKAKKMAEQAQAKMDEVQSQFNQQQGGQQSGAPPVEYDKHGRPIQPAPVAPDAAAPGAPPAAAAPEPPVLPEPPVPPSPPEGAQPDPAAPPAPGAAPSAPAAPPGPAASEDRNRPSNEPPKLSSGDPLAG